MKMRQWICVLLACAAILGGVIPPAMAMQQPGETVVWLDDLEWEWIDLSTVEHQEASTLLRARVSADGTYSAHSIYTITQPVSLQARSTVTFNCSYSPSSASMDFGVITSDGKFYPINVKGGSINQTLGISQAGSYQVAIRNNSSQTVSVVGFVEY